MSCGSPAATNVDRRTRKDEGEYDAPVTPERLVFLQKVVGQTVVRQRLPDYKDNGPDLQSNGGGLRISPFLWRTTDEDTRPARAPSFDEPGKGHEDSSTGTKRGGGEVTSGRDLTVLKVFFGGASKLLFGA